MHDITEFEKGQIVGASMARALVKLGFSRHHERIQEALKNL